VLRRLLDAVESDERIRAFALDGSAARGRADKLSDLDTRLWIADHEFEAMLADLPSLARGLGEPLDILFETPGSHYLFVQSLDGVQVELHAARASQADGRFGDEIVLLDRDGILQALYEEPPRWDADLWVGWAWMRLYDLDKYLRRGSLWRALIKLEEARTLLLRHHAAATGLPEPELGLTSVLNHDGNLPARLEETVAGLDASELRRAAHICAELLAEYEQRPFADFVHTRLAEQGQSR
jgi:predicted nucleotidyltransferase